MKLSDFDYHLPKNLIAQEPMRPRDHSRLLVLRKKTYEETAARGEAKPLRFNKSNRSGLASFKRGYFHDLPAYLRAGDVLVLNNSRVFPARLVGRKKETGGKIEIFLLRKIRGHVWQCLLGGHGRKENLEIEFGRGLEGAVLKDNGGGTWDVKFNKGGSEFIKIVNKIGLTPLPPYIKRKTENGKRMSDRKDYQTVYADEKKIGSVAAPTAGFHFTPRLIKKLKSKGVQFEYVTLHVGLGTFAPVKANDITKHKMHAEYVEVKKGVIKNIIKAKSEGRRIIAVGTTSVRSLEAVFGRKEYKRFLTSLRSVRNDKEKRVQNFQGWVDIFIYPGYKFQVVDGMITNFHLPKSTLLMLVSAFAGKKNIDKAYKAAINDKYRFYSYGDAMLII